MIAAGRREEIEATGTCKIYNTEMKREVVGASAFEDSYLLFTCRADAVVGCSDGIYYPSNRCNFCTRQIVVPQAPIHFLTRDRAGSQILLTHSSTDQLEAEHGISQSYTVGK